MGNKLFVGSLPFSTTEEQVREMFAEFGTLTEVKLIMDRMSGRSKGFAFVTYEDEQNAQSAIGAMNGKSVEGRTIVVNEAKPMEARPRRDSYGGDSGFGGGRDEGFRRRY